MILEGKKAIISGGNAGIGRAISPEPTQKRARTSSYTAAMKKETQPSPPRLRL